LIVGRLTSGDKYGMHIQHENKVHNTFIYKKNIQKIVGKRTTDATHKKFVGKKTTGATCNKLWGRRQLVQRLMITKGKA
jgi:hypothetical protein